MKYLIVALSALFLMGCQNNGDADNFTITGTAQGMADGTNLTVYQVNPTTNQPAAIDTVTVTGGKFTATYPKSEMRMVNYFALPQGGSVAYFPENEDLEVVIYKDSVQASYVTGSPQNDSYRTFTNEIRKLGKQREQVVARYREAQRNNDAALLRQLQQENTDVSTREKIYKSKFIAENGNSIFSVMLISEMMNRKEMNAIEAKDAIAKLSPELQETAMVAKIKATIEDMSAAEIGAKAPEFSAKTPDGQELGLKDALGKYTIIDFWASWCKPCRRENPNVVNVYQKYHDKGLNIISVSLDRQGQRDRWIQAIEDDNMDWYHVSNLQFWQDPIAKMYNVRSIPATFLLDENGVIIDKNLRGPALENKIASLLN
ncbi:MAG TPA: AhpC/TSA family protein [Flavobacteriaceae bacterium]|nr:peroxiredoxin [Flavobacteriaceae bacterium]HIB46752.1 AhpC/TSA family protein [Flavobacteriaceae bacterium]HIN98616.1 AhpC/TSA family protein [Flavobacteriaceae bacterium]|tara:strand:- start:2693 stop:3811 length:1119 start_codon:yes stop_codon:yes gene_type:complete